MITLNIPATWRIVPNQETDKDIISLELWLFWFDNKHTNIVEKDIQLKQLQGKASMLNKSINLEAQFFAFFFLQKQKADPSIGIK
jgi:hypothetical protein